MPATSLHRSSAATAVGSSAWSRVMTTSAALTPSPSWMPTAATISAHDTAHDTAACARYLSPP